MPARTDQRGIARRTERVIDYHLTNQPQRELKALGKLRALPSIPPQLFQSKEYSTDFAGRDPRATADEGLWVAVLPFKSTSASADLAALSEGLTDDIVTGLSRFSYLRIIVPRSAQHYANQAIDLRVAGKEPGAARLVMEGTLRHERSKVRIAVKLVDTLTGTNLWADSDPCALSPEARFKLQDKLVPRIVSTVADARGVLAQIIGESLRSRALDDLSPYKAVLRSFAYFNRLNAGEHALARIALELAKSPKAPGQSEALAWLAIMYREEFVHGFKGMPDPLGRASKAAHEAIDIGPSNHWAHLALASVLYYQREISAFRNEAKQVIDSNPMGRQQYGLFGQSSGG
jgi:adenylate cyclase